MRKHQSIRTITYRYHSLIFTENVDGTNDRRRRLYFQLRSKSGRWLTEGGTKYEDIAPVDTSNQPPLTNEILVKKNLPSVGKDVEIKFTRS
jgi:hypothetical protein